jgi:hypothetical protein
MKRQTKFIPISSDLLDAVEEYRARVEMPFLMAVEHLIRAGLAAPPTSPHANHLFPLRRP